MLAETMQALDEAQENPVEISRETMLGDLIRVVIDEIKAAPDVWDRLSEFHQNTVIERVQARCEAVARQAINIIAAENHKRAVAKVEKVEFKDGCKATIIPLASIDMRHDLADSAGKHILVVFPGDDYLENLSTKPKAQADQRPMDFEESDSLYEEAENFVVKKGAVSITAVQRELRIGYNRAARLIEQMEANGVVSEIREDGTREVISKL